MAGRVTGLENLLSDCVKLTPDSDLSSLLEIANKLILRLGGQQLPDMIMQTSDGMRHVVAGSVLKPPEYKAWLDG